VDGVKDLEVEILQLSCIQLHVWWTARSVTNSTSSPARMTLIHRRFLQ